MNKEEIEKIKRYVLKVNINCDGCKNKVKKVLQKIDGVYMVEIDSEQGKVIVYGNVDPNILIKKLVKSGKLAQLWDAPRGNNNNKNNNQNNIANQMKNTQNDNGGNDSGENKSQEKGDENIQAKGRQQALNPQQQQLLQQQLLQQLQQMERLQDHNLPLQFKDMKQPTRQNPNQKGVKFNLPEVDDCMDNECDDNELDDKDFDEDDINDEIDNPHVPLNKTKGSPPIGNGPQIRLNGMINGNHHQQLMNALKNANAGGNGKKEEDNGRGWPILIQKPSINDGNIGNKGGGARGGEGNNQNQGGSSKNSGGKNGGGILEGKNRNNGNINGGGANGGNPGNNNGNRGKMGNSTTRGIQVMSTMGGYPSMGGGNMDPMGNKNMPIGSMGNISAIQGLPAIVNMNDGGGSPRGYFQGSSSGVILGNSFHKQQQQQQYMTAMMNQQRVMEMGNERFLQMMHGRPPPLVNFMYPQYPYPYPPPQDPYTNFFNDENTSSCSIM